MTEVASLLPVDHKVSTERRYEAGPPEGLQLVEPGETVATTKEEEWISKKKTEVTNTKQIETRVKRQVVLEDGKVVEDSGPLVTTNTTEDTETTEHHQTELRKLGDEENDEQKALEGVKNAEDDKSKWVSTPNPDGVVREVKERRVLSREEVEEVKETEDVQHLGDITDEDFLSAVHSGDKDLRPLLRRRAEEGVVVSTGPRVVHESQKSNKVVDTEDTRELSSVLPDGRIVTETQRTTEHEEVRDEELPDDAPDTEIHKESSQRFFKTREQQDVDYLKDGVNVGHEMRFKTENMEVERRGDGMDDFLDWDSLSARARRRRDVRPPHRYRGLETNPAQQSPLDRKDALTKKPLNFDVEEETRKHETSKWLEHHFGSDSRSSNNSLDGDDVVEEKPPKTSFFNVTIKSQPTRSPEVETPIKTYPVYSPIDSGEVEVTHGRYYQGITDWSERRRDTPSTTSPSLRSPPPDYRIPTTPTPPQRKRAAERRLQQQQHVQVQRSPSSQLQDSPRYDSGYRTPSRNEFVAGRGEEEEEPEEPPPDYSPPTPPPQPKLVEDRRQQQRTRFAETQTQTQKQKGNIIGQSIRKLVGKIRSASAERKAKQRAKRSPSPSYQKGHVIDNINNGMQTSSRPRSPPVQRYYLGEDPFGGSIYGKENKYDGVKPASRSSRRPEDRSQSTLGRFSKSTGRLVPRTTPEPRNSQTLPRHLSRHEPPTRLEKGDKSNSTINVSIINTVAAPIVNGGPPKPARSYRSNLSRSKSLNVHAAGLDQRSGMHKSNPHLHRLDESPIGLKSPALISSLSRSQRDLNEINSRDHYHQQQQQQQQYSYTPRFGARNGYGDDNGYDVTDSKKVFLKSLKDRAPELFRTLHETDETDPWRTSSPHHYAPSKPARHVYNGGDPYEPPTRLRDSPVRRGSSGSNDYTETFRTTSRNDDPMKPSVTNTVQTFSKKTLPGRDGRGVQTIESMESKSVTKSGYRERGYGGGVFDGRRGSPVVIEVRNNYRK